MSLAMPAESATTPGFSKLFAPGRFGPLQVRNRIVMAPMTRQLSPGGMPHEGVARYYRRRAEADVGLIITEGCWIDHPGASNDPGVPRFYGDALDGWRKVLAEVHAAGAKIIPQLWHIGLYTTAAVAGFEKVNDQLRPDQVGPSGYSGTIGVAPTLRGKPMTDSDIADVIQAYAKSAEASLALGFDGIALHAAHGYLIDQFFWAETNRRDDRYGGSIAARTTFAAEIVREIRRRTAPDFPIMLRFSQWKLQNYAAKLVQTPDELMQFLAPLVDAGVDIFDCSQRRFWEPEFAGSELNLAGWTRKLSGKPTMTVGSVGLDGELIASFSGEASHPASLEKLFARLERDEFDLVGVGRALLADAEWARKVRAGLIHTAKPYSAAALAELV
ncbi:NADH:flavin oxidoreductase [Solimonas soli]|uniref:NADH:flavin oxidoreductase n=1 Tax=Solimonas soli TaxID=413479 RepID=UPI001FE0E06C|nr:NADH:flavin oxidoreductase [Solimonas soli]